MTHNQIRGKFLNFFKQKNHKIVDSSSLIPDDPSVLFTTAGMQQFKRYYLDLDSPYGNRVASIQKCLRTSDIEEVGDESHLTFFEMLGNFSFKYPEGDNSYFKEKAIKFAWEFINEELGIPIDRIKISIFKGEPKNNIPTDQESLKIWKDIGIPENKIIFGGREDNFWGPTGDKGPCGPTTEIYIDNIEIWNIVFNEYYCDKENHIVPLDRKGVDTGMGLERLAMILQNKKSVFETDLFAPIITEIRGRKFLDSEINQKAERIISDHLKSSIFLIGDGVVPSNVEGGYILRRLIRRLIRYAKILSLEDEFYQRAIKTIIKIYKDYYPDLEKKQNEIVEIFNNEYNKFSKALDKGLKEFRKLKQKALENKKMVVSGIDAFNLYQSFGFPIEFTQELAKESNLNVDIKEFYKEQEKHRKISKAGQEKKFGGHGLILDTGELKATNQEELKRVIRLHTATHILHSALRELFGPNIKQQGCDITAERLRFDFSFPRKLTKEEIKELEKIVNDVIKMDLSVTCEEMPYDKAIKLGALAFFKEKYPSVVKVYTIGDKDGHVFSRELCGGPHVSHTGEIGNFRILKQESVGSGVRRIRATVE